MMQRNIATVNAVGATFTEAPQVPGFAGKYPVKFSRHPEIRPKILSNQSFRILFRVRQTGNYSLRNRETNDLTGK